MFDLQRWRSRRTSRACVRSSWAVTRRTACTRRADSRGVPLESHHAAKIASWIDQKINSLST